MLKEDIKKQRYYFANIGPSSQGYGFSSGHVWMWELDCEECWAPKNWCFWSVVLEKTLESPLDCKEIQPVHPKGDQSWVFIGRSDVEVETPILWLPDAKRWLFGKDADAGKDWRQEEKGTTEDEMTGCITDSMNMSLSKLQEIVKVKVALCCLTLCDSMDYTVHGILQARILEWVAFPFSRGFSQPKDRTHVSHIAGGFFTSWVTGKPKNTGVGSLSLLQQIFPT